MDSSWMETLLFQLSLSSLSKIYSFVSKEEKEAAMETVMYSCIAN